MLYSTLTESQMCQSGTRDARQSFARPAAPAEPMAGLKLLWFCLVDLFNRVPPTAQRFVELDQRRQAQL